MSRDPCPTKLTSGVAISVVSARSGVNRGSLASVSGPIEMVIRRVPESTETALKCATTTVALIRRVRTVHHEIAFLKKG